MQNIHPGEQVVSMVPDGESIEVYTVVKVLPDGVQVDGASGKLSKTALRVFSEAAVNRIKEKETQLKGIKQEIRHLYDTLDGVD
jgi:hypothetical protein